MPLLDNVNYIIGSQIKINNEQIIELPNFQNEK